MKTTIDIADPLLRKAKQRAARDGTTLRSLVERGLENVLAESKKTKPHKFEIIPFKGEGLTDEFKNATWDDYLNAIYGTPGFDRD